MIISKDFYNRCPPSYKKAIVELEQQLANINVQDDSVSTVVQKQLAVLSFSKRYLTPKEYWEYCLRYIESSKESSPYYKKWKQCSSEIAKSICFHLYYCNNHHSHIYYQSYGHKEPKFLNFFNKHYFECDIYEVYEEDLEYPHDCLEECFRYFERNATKLPSAKLIKRYEEMVELYQKIKAAENGDTEKWFKLVLEVGDTDFVMANVEFRLGQNLLDAKLWKLYIAFLKKAGQYKCLIETYSKYCRLFLDDNEMKEQYRQENVKFGPIYLTWENLFEFEQKPEMSDDDESDYDEPERKKPLNKSLCTSFYDTYKFQRFPFRASFIRYIMNNASHRVLRKLFSTCKYFYAKKSTPICYSFKTGPDEHYDEENLTLKFSSNQEQFLKKTYITGKICVERNQEADANFLSNVIPRLYRCEAKFISLCNQNLSFKEIRFLIEHGGLVDFDMMNCKSKDDSDKDVFLEDIMAFLPNIEKLNLSDIKINANTGHALSNQKFFGKIYEFGLFSILGKPFDTNEFLKFLIANRDEKRLDCIFEFDDEFDAVFIERFKEIMEGYGKSCENTKTSIVVDN